MARGAPSSSVFGPVSAMMMGIAFAGMIIYSVWVWEQTSGGRGRSFGSSTQAGTGAIKGPGRNPNGGPNDPYTLEEVMARDGRDENTPVWMAVKGVVYDVSKGRQFYGKGGGYSALCCREASRRLATGKLDDNGSSMTGLGEDEWKALDDWAGFYDEKYHAIGYLVDKDGKPMLLDNPFAS